MLTDQPEFFAGAATPARASAPGRWPMLLAALLTAAMVVGLGHELLGSGLAGLARAVPRDPLYYLAFIALYAAPPFCDFVIFRRLWGIGAGGLAALGRKRIANDVVLGYSGEAYFYAWARAQAAGGGAPFGAVKDVGILSAMAGNAATLAALLAALPLGVELLGPGRSGLVAASAAVVVATSLPFLFFSRCVFSLPATALRWIFAVHCVRLAAGSLLLALAWHLALPGVGVGTWLLLAAGRLLVSRLPLLPNKDLLFANLAVLSVGRDQAVSELVAFTAAATLATHLLLLAGLGVVSLGQRAAAATPARRT